MSDYIYVNGELYHADELMHYGVKGMKWGVRRYQNPDGSLTAAGRKHEAKQQYKSAKKEYKKAFNKAYNKSAAAYSPIKKHRKANDERWNKAVDAADKLNESKQNYKNVKKQIKQEKQAAKNTPEAKAARQEKMKKALKVGAAVAATALAAYGGKKLHDVVRDKNFEVRVKQAKKIIKNIEKDYTPALSKINPHATMQTMTSDGRLKTVFIADHEYDRLGRMTEGVMRDYVKKADTDSFGTAVKNVATDYIKRKRKR